MKKTYTLKELADIGSKAACLDTAGAVKLHQNCREAFTKAILDAVGYEFPKDEEREAFEKWCSRYPNLRGDMCFEVWKAGREALREELRVQGARAENELAAEVSQDGPPWIPWSGGECPLPDTVIKWQLRFRSGNEQVTETKPKTFYWWHDGDECDIVAYRVIKS